MNQHHTPCKQCPFRRVGLPGYLGGSTPETFMGQAHGEFYLPCHMTYINGNPREFASPQCAGAAIYRANVCKAPRSAFTLQLPADKDKVFAAPAEFIAFHKRITVAEAEQQLLKKSVAQHLIDELSKTEVGYILTPKQ